MITFKYTSYNKLPIAKYKEILNITEEDLTPIEKDLEIIAVLCDTDVNEIYKLKASEVNLLQSQLSFLSKAFTTNKKYKTISINGNKYKVNSKLDELQIAQYIDFQMIWDKENYIDHLHEILSIFLIPEGKEYNEGYDILKVREEIYEFLDIETATSIAFFLHRKLVSLIQDKVLYFRLMLWVMKWKMKDKELKKKMKELMNLYKTMEKHLTDGYLSLMKSLP